MAEQFHLGVVAHVDRQQQIRQLSNELHPDIINVDDGTLGAPGNHFSTIAALHRKHPHDWIVLMEDDAQPVDFFNDQVGKALSVAPTEVVSFYTGTGYPAQYQGKFEEAMSSDACWLLHPQLRHAVCYALHSSIRKALMTRMEKLISQRWAPDDAIGKWAVENRKLVAYSNPSLVDHEDGKTVIDYRMHLGHVSVAGRKRPRKAHNLGIRRTWDDSSVRVMGP